MTRDTDWAYLAALIDGEGSLGCYVGRRNHTPQPRVVISMSTQQPILWVYETFLVGRYKDRIVKANGRLERRFTWGTYSKAEVWEILDGCLPYMKLKANKAKEVMSQCRFRYRTHG